MPDPATSSPQEDTQEIVTEAYVEVKGLPQRKHWSKSWKVRCCWIADIWPVTAGMMQLIGQMQAGESLRVDSTTVWQAMLPWLLLAFNELATDAIKVWHEWKTGVRG